MLILFYFLLGLAFGSFANVYAYRIPKNLSLWKPNSFCPHCNHSILWYDNIPILSFLLLKGQCRFCREKISLCYPLIETLSGILFLAVSLKFRSAPIWEQTAFLIFSYLLFLIAVIDIITYFQSEKQYGIIPDHLVWILACCGLFYSPFNPILQKNWLLGLAGSFSGTLFTLFIRWLGEKIFKKESLGLGDVKMVAAIGFWIGWQGIAANLIISSAIGSIVGVGLILGKKLDRGASVPFAPFITLGSWSVLFFY